MGRPQSVQSRLDKFFGFRPRSIAETHDFLSRRLKLNPDDQRKQLVKLQSFGLLNDIAFTRWWVEERTSKRPRSAFLIRRELLAKGVDKSIIDSVLGEERVSDNQTIDLLVEKKLPNLIKRYGDETAEKKLISHLLRRGYSYSLSKQAVEKYKSRE